MSRLLPSACAIPFVMSGMATTPPLPLDAVRPAPSRLNQVSSVNVAALRPGAGPNVTRLLTPSNRNPVFAEVVTVTVVVSLMVNVPSVAVSANTYVPAVEKVAVVAAAPALPNVTVPGPLDLLHARMGVLSMSATEPTSDAAAGSATGTSGPAFTNGASLTAVIVIATVAT